VVGGFFFFSFLCRGKQVPESEVLDKRTGVVL
jgi:hypothetical protein